MTRFIMRRGPTVGAVYELTGEKVSIGRGAKNDIIIQDNEVSRDHCVLIRARDGYEVRDLGSSNGTYVNGHRITESWPLQAGHFVELGDSITLEYLLEPVKLEPPPLISDSSLPDAPKSYQSARVTVVQGPQTGQTYALTGMTINIGRDLSNDLVLQDPEVSRFHARMIRKRDGYAIEDLNSTNGTFINDIVTEALTQLQEQDMVKLGNNVQLRYETQPSAEFTTEDHATIMRRPAIDLNSFVTDTNARNSLIGVTKRVTSTSLGTGMEPGSLQDHIMIAYDRQDWERMAAPLVLGLQDAGIKVWVEQYFVQGEPDWRAAVEQALYESWLMVVLISKHTYASNHVRSAYTFFMNRDKPLIPVLYDPKQTLPVELAKKRAILYDDKEPKRTLHKLIFEIMELRKQIRP